MKRLIVPPILTFIFALVLIGCEGPEGPAGLTGSQGGQGVAGVQGPVGPAGNANVQSFTVILIAASFADNGVVESVDFSVPTLTRAVVNGGAVLAYTDLGAGPDVWVAMPVSIAGVNMTYVITPGFFSVFLIRPAGAPAVAPAFNGFRVRVVVIPPAQAGRLDSIDESDYEAVRSALGF